MKARRPGPTVRWLLRAPVLVYRWNAGWLLGRRFLLLTHVGRHSGRHYHTVLEVIGTSPTEGELFVVAGLGRSAQWYRNLKMHPAVEVAVGHHRFKPVYRELDKEDAAAVLADYEQRNRWAAPVVHRFLTWLVGWPYDGSEDARLRLVRELPGVAFRAAQDRDHPGRHA
ncbi:MAG: nitroreductase family deazaflavin-dependent oxidoreductase [Acidimicrobiales bacterium]